MSNAQAQQPGDNMRVHRPLGTQERVNEQASVEEIVVHGRKYLVFPLIAAREMVLDYPENGTRELLPARHLQESLPLWEGTPITFIHPENERRTADDPREYTQTIIGQAYQPELKDNEKLRVMAYIDVNKARDFGGLAETVVDKLKAGEPLGVSAGYATLNDDKSGGNFNGEEYDVEQGYIIPDHIAIFPNDEFTARCDWEDGCGAPRVNYEVPTEEANNVNDQRPYPDHLKDRFESEEAAEKRAAELGCDGTHTHPDDDDIVMPCNSHFEYEEALANQRQNRLTACEVQANYDVDRETAEQLRTLVNETIDPTTIDHESLPEFEEGDLVELHALPGVTGRIVHIPDTPAGIAMVDLFDEGTHTVTLGLGDLVPLTEGSDEPTENAEPKPRTNIPENTEEYTLTRAGEYVRWDTGSEQRFGRVDEAASDGCLSVGESERCAEDGDGTRIVRVDEMSEDGDDAGNQHLLLVRRDGPNEGNLRSWDAPRAARQNYEAQDNDMTDNIEEDPATLFQRFLSSIGMKANAASAEVDGAEELMDGVSETEDTTEESDADTEDDDPDVDVDEGDTESESESESESAETEMPDDEGQEPTDADDTTESEDDTSSEDSESVKENTVEDVGGEDSEQDTETDAGETSDDNTDMKENQEGGEGGDDGPTLDLADIAAKTAFGISELEEMDDQMVEALERTVIEMSDDDYSDTAEAEEAGAEQANKDYDDKYAGERANTEEGESSESEADEGTETQTNTEQTENTMDENESTEGGEENTVNTDEFLTTDEAEEQFASKEDVEQINTNVEQIKGMVQNIQTEQEDEQKEEKARMVANAIEGMSVEAAKQLPEEELDNLADTHATRTNYAAVPGQRGQVVTNTQSDEDLDEWPAGGRSEWEARKAEGGD